MYSSTQTTPTLKATEKAKASYNWASIQLNLIMLPVGVSLLIIVSLTACLCHWLRKKRIKRLQKELRRQRKTLERQNRNEARERNNFASFSRSPTRNFYACNSRDNTDSPVRKMSFDHTHPATVRKEKLKRQQILKDLSLEEKKRSSEKEKISSNRENSDNCNGSSGSKGITGNQGSGIPLAVKSKTREHKRNSVESCSLKPSSSRNASFDAAAALLRNSRPYTIGIDSLRSTKDRKKWEVPSVSSVEYDKQGSLHLPPLAEMRTVKTA